MYRLLSSTIATTLVLTFAASAAAAPGPAAPSAVSARALSTSAIGVFWSSTDPQVTGFTIERSLNGQNFSVVARVGNVRSYQDNGLAKGTLYYYRLRSERGSDLSRRSAVVSAITVNDTTAPTTPTGLSASAKSCTQVSLHWNPSSDSGGAGLARYSIYRNDVVLKQVAATVLSTTDSGLSGGNTYRYAVSAVDGAGNQSARSAAVLITLPSCNVPTPKPTSTPARTATAPPTPTHTATPPPPDLVVPSVPGTLTVTVASCTQLDLRWGASSDNPGGSGLQSYFVYRNGVFLKVVDAPTVTTSDTGLAPSTVYSYAVRAYDKAGNLSGPSNTASANTPSCNQAPTAQAGPDQVANVGAAVTLDASGSRDPDGTITSYLWTFGDGASASGVSVSHAYISSGTYAATLRVTDNAGAQASDTAVVTVSGGTPGGVRWLRHAGGNGYDAAQAIAANANGETVVTGYFNGSADFGTGALSSAGASDVFLAKYSASGSPLWVRRMGGALADAGTAVAFAPDGTIVASGTFSGTVDFGSGPLTSAGGSDIFLAKYSAAGALVWVQRFGGSSGDTSSGVAVAADGTIVLIGAFVGTVDFGTGALSSNSGSTDVFVATYSAAGAARWSKRFGAPANDFANGIAVDRAGSIILVGSYMGAIDFGGGPLPRTAVGSDDIFVAKLSATGNHLWSKSFGDSQSDHAEAVAVDGNDNILVTGYIYGPVDFGGGALHNAFGDYDGDIFVAKFTPAGGHVWSKRFGGSYYDYGQGIAVDAAGNALVTGFFQNTATVGTQALTSAGSVDLIVAKFGPDGTPQWAQSAGGAGDDIGRAIAVDGSGNPVVAGEFWGTSSFGSTQVTSAGQNDAFLLGLRN